MPVQIDRVAPPHLRLVFIIASAALLWLLFMTLHEFGHVVGAVVSGGGVHGVELRPWRLSRTELAANPRPLFVAWAGPVLGVVMALAVLAASSLIKPCRWMTALAAFCCLVNGVYIASGVVTPVGDTADMLRLGSPHWTLAAFGVPVTIGGFWLLHTLGPGLGTAGFSARTLTRRLIWTLGAIMLLSAAMAAISMIWPV